MNLSETQNKKFRVIEQILDADLLNNGITSDQIEEMKHIAQIERRLLAAGRNLEEINAEWEGKTAVQIITAYQQQSLPTQVLTKRIVTNWIRADIKELTKGQPRSVVLKIIFPLRTGEDYSSESHVIVSSRKHWEHLWKCHFHKKPVEVQISMELDNSQAPTVLVQVREAKSKRLQKKIL